jgi:Heterokaryon incompatibility protein (HET)
MTTFKYKPIGLEGHAFRLLRLLKGDDDLIQCELFESKLAPPEYDYAALSYTWGSESRPCEIMINGSKMTVTKNAYLALRDLRSQEEDRILWIDALCID